MALGPVIKSLLKEVIQEAPEQSVKAQSVVPMLKKKGVKPEEIEFAKLGLPATGKVSKQQLVEAEANRLDEFGQTILSADDSIYQNVSLPGGVRNHTYKEKITQFKQKGKPGYTSSHFKEVPDYLYHSRVYDDDIDGTPTRVVQEIQSDLHQEAKSTAYTSNMPEFTADEEVQLIKYMDSLYDEDIDRNAINTMLADKGVNPDAANGYSDQLIQKLLKREGVPDAPFKDNAWLRKGLERELADAVAEGHQQVAIPIKGAGVSILQRSEGVQKWYESQVVGTAKKLAKQTNSGFELKNVGEINSKYTVTTDTQEDVYRHLGRVDDSGSQASIKYLQTTYGDEAANLARSVKSGDLTLLDAQIAISKDIVNSREGTQYAVINLSQNKAVSANKMDFKLYSTPAATALAIASAYQQGKSKKEVQDELYKQGFDLESQVYLEQLAQDAAGSNLKDQELMDYIQSQEEVRYGNRASN